MWVYLGAMENTNDRSENAAFIRSHEHVMLSANAFCRECGYEISRGKGALMNRNTYSVTCYTCAEAITNAPHIHN